ncbi:MAG: sugar ABC transporter ATP-binding protein, partial [Candidatus Cloacimonetes bacterium]|nr:sugar ABC transporter ATP-binding protein [Candidatus Cloacimonadota bacterium]
KPKVFLFDEPLSNLDAKLRVQMRAEIVKLHQKLDTTIIYVTHDQVEAMTMADKMVVMKDGVIHQIDSPLEIYNNPHNLFVAGFVGSPSINQLKGKIVEEKGKTHFDAGSFKVEVPEPGKLKKYINTNVIMGIRPEDIYDAEFDQMAEFPQQVEALCEVVEPMGNEFIVFLKIENIKITARFDPKVFPKIDENIKITFDMKKAHFFDMETEERI